MEAGGIDVGHVFARLDARLDDKNFKRFDAAVDRSKSKTREMSREQDNLTRSTQTLSREQQRHVKFLRSQGQSWAAVAQQVGVSEDALKSWNTTSKTTVRENEKVRRSNTDTQRSFLGLEGGIAKTNRITSFFSKTLSLIKWPALVAGAGAALQGINALSAGTVGLVSALAPLSGLLVAVPALLGTMGQALGTGALSVMGIGTALKALSAEQSKAGTTAESSAKKQRSASQQIRAAEEQLEGAERSQKTAVVGLDEARRTAIKTLQDMRNAAIDARLGEQGAELALRRSIVELNKAEANPKSTLLEIEELELGVRESHQRVKEARIESKRAQQEDRKEHHGGVRKDPAVVEARRSLNEANREVKKSSEGVAEAEREANETLTETGTTANKVDEAFAKLSPSAAKFARFLFGLQPQLKGLQATAAKGFLPGAEKGITSALRNLPVVNKVIGVTGRVMGTLSERAGKLFGSRGFGHDLEIVGRGNAQTLGLIGRSAEHLFKGLENVMVVAQPFIKFMGRYTNGLAAWVEKSTEVNRKNGDMAKFFGRTRQVVEVLTSIFGNLGGTMHVIGEEAAPLGRQILDALNLGSEGLEKWSKSTRGRDSIAAYFRDAKAPLWEAGRLVRDIVKAFFELGSSQGMGTITELLHQVRVELLPVFTELLETTSETFGPHLIEALTQVTRLFGQLAGASGPLTLYVDALTGASKFTSDLLEANPGLRAMLVNFIGLAGIIKAIKWAGVFTGLTKAMEFAFGADFAGKLKDRVRTAIGNAVKAAFLRGALGLNIVYTWGSEVAAQAAGGISKQIGKFKAVARRAAIAFIGVFAPEVAAGMAAGGRLGEVLSAKFPRLAKMFEGGGKLAGRAFVIGALIGAALIGYELGQMFAESHPKTALAMRQWGENAGQNFVNALIDIVNLGIKGINAALDKANPLGKLGVHAPHIGEVGHVKWDAAAGKKGEWEQAERESQETPTGQKARREAERRTPKKTKRREHQEAEAPVSNKEARANYEMLWGQPPPAGPPPWPPPRQFRGRAGAVQRGSTSEMSLGGRGGKKAEGEAQDTRKKVTAEHHKLRRDVGAETQGMEKEVLDRFTKIRKGSSDEARKMDKAVGGSAQDMQGTHDKATKAMLGNTDSRFEGMREIVSKRSSSMSETLGQNVGQMDRVTSEGMQHIQGATIRALKAFGVKNVNLSLKGDDSPGGKNRGAPQKLASGGVFTVPGEGLQDSVYLPGVHAMVAPGEDLFAANRHQQPLLDYAVEAALGVQGGLDGFFATYDRPHYMAKGGRAPRPTTSGGHVVLDAGVNMGVGSEPAIYRDLKALSAELGKVVYVISGYRSPAHSVEVGGFANDPHTRGEAADIGVGSPLLDTMFGVSEAALKAVGLYRPFYPASAHEVNHVQLLAGGASGALVGPAGSGARQRIKHLKAPHVLGPDGTFATLAQTALDRATAGANKYLDKKAGARSSAGGLGLSVANGPIQKMAREMVAQVWSPSEFGAFNSLEMQEAGWNPRAENPESGAAGLAQALPPSKYPAGAWPYSGIKSARLQLEWMVNYIRERYGSPAGAWAHEQSAGWYARGGRMLRHLARGGGVKGVWGGTSIDKTYPKSDGTSGATLPPYIAAALGEWAGLPGVTMAQIGKSENLLHPGTDVPDPPGRSFGWLAIHQQSNPGTTSATMRNPILAALQAKDIVGDGLPSSSIWHATKYVTGYNQHYRGDPAAIARHLGGRGEEGASPKTGVWRGHDASKPWGKGPKKKTALGGSEYAATPTGRYSPASLLQLAAETGIGLPFSLMKDGRPDWRSMPVLKYTKIVDDYLRRVAEYRTTLGEERKAAEESFPSNPLLTSVTALSPNTISEAIGYHSPVTPETGAYSQGYSSLAALDQLAAGRRSSYLNTFTEGHLAPYERKRSEVTDRRDAVIASLKPEREQREFARAKLRGLRKRLRNGDHTKRRRGAAKRARGGRVSRPSGRSFARGGRLLAKGGKAKAAVSAGRSAKVMTPAQQRKRVAAQIRKHGAQVKRRATRRGNRAEQRYEEESEGILDPVEREREEIEEREAFETARREELAPLLSEIALNVQRTALVGASQSALFSAPTFARGGQITPGSVPAPGAAVGASNPSVHVPFALHLSGAMEALNPHISAVVDGRLRELGHAAGTARTTVSAPGRRVSYGGK